MTGKRGSSRRKGDDFQDLTSLRFALENYLNRRPFEMFLEYEKSGNLDDIVVFCETEIVAYQVKYAVHNLSVYELNDFLEPDSPVYIRKFAESWKILSQRFPGHHLTAALCSNRGLDAELVALVTEDGRFLPEFIENRKRGEAKKIRSNLATASGLTPETFTDFLNNFRFVLRQPPLPDLEQYIKTVLMDKQLGLSEDAIFFDLKDAVKNNAIYSREAITAESIDKLLQKVQSKLLIPQVFPVNQNHFVEQKSLSEQLDQALPSINGGYLVVTGLPGSGKSTSLTTYFERLDRNFAEIFTYYCFVGVNDNARRMRVQSESLRANLLDAFQRRYPDILKRRYDYSEQNFLKCLEDLAQHFVKQNRRLIIFLDGLDHAERLEPEVRETVIAALPATIPNGVTFVVGTQELHKWPYFLKQARECSENHIQMPLFSEEETKDYLCNKRGISSLSHAEISEICRKCQGLPLYLRYAAEKLLTSESAADTLASLFPASGGDIRCYYELLWEEFDRGGMANAKHLCAVIACLRFSIHRDEFYIIQKELRRPDFENAFKCMSHLLRSEEDRLTIFHNSFREFVISQISQDWVNEIRGHISSFLQRNKDTPRWFGHVFEYSYEAGEYSYVLNEVNTEFVDRALLHCRPTGEILDAIHWAVESAFKCEDIVQLSRLGPLKFRTSERLDYHLDRSLLAKALLALGREQDVMSFAYSQDSNRWIVDNQTALSVMFNLAKSGKLELGGKLFEVFTNEFRGVDSDGDRKSKVMAIASCLGIYLEKIDRPLRWLSQFRLEPDILEQNDPFAPGYAPHLAKYIDSLVLFGFEEKWTRLKRVKKLFPNNLVRYLLIRSLVRFNLIQKLHSNINEYLKQEGHTSNVELAFYAAKAGMPQTSVTAIAGTIEAPKIKCDDYIARSDPALRKGFYSFIIIGYEANNKVYESFSSLLGRAESLWSSALKHLLKAGFCIGQSLTTESGSWYDDAVGSIDILVKANQGERERIFESIDLIRDILPLSIGFLTECVDKHYPEKLSDWANKLKSLRDSFLWNTHFGINESCEDYSFELNLWEKLTQLTSFRRELGPILNSCANTFEKATMLKGECRSHHFIWLAFLMAKCRMRKEAEKWLHYGIRSSLIYGYRKDATLSYLIDILKLINLYKPELALERCGRVLTMVDWMPHLTDGRTTKWFPEIAFDAVLVANRWAAFELLKQFSQTIARWKMLDCLESYILSAKNGEPAYLWCLSELFVNHFSEDGRHCKQFMKSRQHIVELAKQSYPEAEWKPYADGFKHFLLTEISPRHWPQELKEERGVQDRANAAQQENNGQEKIGFTLDGKHITKEELLSKCQVAFSEFTSIFDKLKKQNEHFYERDLIDSLLSYHISSAGANNDLFPIKNYIEQQGQWQNSATIHTLAERFQKFGDQENAIACFSIAYGCYGEKQSEQHLAAVAKIDKQIAKNLILKQCYESVCGTGGGYGTPSIAATGFDVLGEPLFLEEVFSDFLSHCEAMFVQLHQDKKYEWLNQYAGPSEDENQLIVNFVIDELDTTELDHGERLIRALTQLSIVQPENAVSHIVNRLLTSSGLVLNRLLLVLHSLAEKVPEILVEYQQVIVPQLDRKNFFVRQTVLRIFELMAKCSTLDAQVIYAIQNVERTYSENIFHSTFRFSSRPSAAFVTFFKRATLFDFPLQIRTMERILHIDQGSLVAAIEERLLALDWSLDEESECVKNDWRGHVHPQGWPAVWITTRFQERATGVLWNVLNESAEKFKLTKDQLDRLWRASQAVDPECVTKGVKPRPMDISPLHVTEKDTWFDELNKIEDMEIATSTKQKNNTDWITVFERRSLAQEEKYNVPYRQEIFLSSYLIPQQVYGGANILDKVELTTERIVVPGSEGAITLSQARSILTGRGSKFRGNSWEESIPLIAVHENPLTFMGYRSVCSLASYIIDQFSLSFVDFNLVRDDQTVAIYEVWQEGYQDESYSREKLSFGVRLKVSRALLVDICRQYQKVFCTRIAEKREYYKSIYEKMPTEKIESRRYVLFHL